MKVTKMMNIVAKFTVNTEFNAMYTSGLSTTKILVKDMQVKADSSTTPAHLSDIRKTRYRPKFGVSLQSVNRENIVCT